MAEAVIHPASYRDPSGFIFEKEGVLYRQIDQGYKAHYDFLIQSGLYEKLVTRGLLLAHNTMAVNITGSSDWFLTLIPERLPFISYPYEWSFDMLKDAAWLTLEIQQEALNAGMMLKDASPYNVQWREGKPVFIDTLSFEIFEERPWVAYRQFIECFLSPLLVMHYHRLQMPQLLLAYPEGIPLNVARALLPWRSRFNPAAFLHVHLQSNLAKRNSRNARDIRLSRKRLQYLVQNLQDAIKKLKTPTNDKTWEDYYKETERRGNYLEGKKRIIKHWLERSGPFKTALDLGANEGLFAKMLAEQGIFTVAADSDASSVNRLYLEIKQQGLKRVQPLVLDAANPSPAIGLNNEERESLTGRIKTDLTVALGLIHHLSIGRNIPLERLAGFLKKITGRALIIEWISKEDEKVREMLERKTISYDGYEESNFVKIFERYFDIKEHQKIDGTERTLYFMENR